MNRAIFGQEAGGTCRERPNSCGTAGLPATNMGGAPHDPLYSYTPVDAVPPGQKSKVALCCCEAHDAYTYFERTDVDELLYLDYCIAAIFTTAGGALFAVASTICGEGAINRKCCTSWEIEMTNWKTCINSM